MTSTVFIGISFALVALGSGLRAQEDQVDVDPFSPDATDAVSPWSEDDYPDNWELIWEVFSLPLQEAANLNRRQLGSAQLY